MSQRALVTGGSSGIGLAIARAMAADGKRVTVLSRRPPPGASGDDIPLDHLAADLGSPPAVCDALAGWLQRTDGEVDTFVHSAVAYGSEGRHPLAESTIEEWDQAMAVNARGLLVCLQMLLPPMQHCGRGLILGISSDVAVVAGPGRVPYAASKAAAHAILIGLAAELVDTGIAVVELMPTHQVDTPGLRRRRPADFTPTGYAAPTSFCAPVRWLLAGNAWRRHGECLRVDPHGRLYTAAGEPLP